MRRLSALAALLWLLLTGVSASAQEQPPPSLEAYRQTIDQALALVRRDEAGQAADLLASVTAVALPGGETMPVDHDWFVRALRVDEAVKV